RSNSEGRRELVLGEARVLLDILDHDQLVRILVPREPGRLVREPVRGGRQVLAANAGKHLANAFTLVPLPTDEMDAFASEEAIFERYERDTVERDEGVQRFHGLCEDVVQLEGAVRGLAHLEEELIPLALFGGLLEGEGIRQGGRDEGRQILKYG